jgi:hypothetical protein
MSMPGISMEPSAGTTQGPRVMTTACFCTTVWTGASGPSHPVWGGVAPRDAVASKEIAAVAAMAGEPVLRLCIVFLIQDLAGQIVSELRPVCHRSPP